MNNKFSWLLALMSLLLIGSSFAISHPFFKWFDSVKNHDLYRSNTIERIYDNWLLNDKIIESVNSQNLTYNLGHNLYSGLSLEEFSGYMGFDNKADLHLQTQRNLFEQASNNLTVLPTSIDWTVKGAVTPVKDQGQCGSCWSFSTTGALEGAYAIKYSSLVSFSEQQLVDCDLGVRLNHGCNGGLMDSAFSWIGSNGGLCTESDYPYFSGTTKTNGVCQTTCKSVSGSKVAKYVDVTPNSDTAMMTAVAQQPVSIAIEADQSSFQLYKSGVFTGTCGTNLDHGVLVVGYGSDNGVDYYKVKNSWSSSWGEGGYIRLGRGSQYNKGAGQCGMLMQGSYPVV